jgi:hypothetical protein
MIIKKKNSWSTTLPTIERPSSAEHLAEDDTLNALESTVVQQSMDAYDDVRTALKKAKVDEANRWIVWNDSAQLSITESAERIHTQLNEYSLELIENKIISWLEMDFEPEGYSQEKMDEFDELVCQWTDEHKEE